MRSYFHVPLTFWLAVCDRSLWIFPSRRDLSRQSGVPATPLLARKPSYECLGNSFSRLGHSLSARLLVIFVIATLIYGFAARYAFTLFRDTDYLRRIVGSHIVLHSEYILNDIGSPPNLERAQAIVEKIPVDLRIVGPGVDWSSSPDSYPPEDVPFGPLSFLKLGEASRKEVEAWAKDLDKVEIAQ